LQLASEAKVALAKLKYKLNSKLSFSLQKAVISHFNTESTFYKFAKQYTIYDQSLKAIKERESHVQKPRNINKTNTPTATTPTITTATTTTLPTPPLYKYLLKYAPEAYILESFALAVKQCK
jgi:lysozyme family protein